MHFELGTVIAYESRNVYCAQKAMAACSQEKQPGLIVFTHCVVVSALLVAGAPWLQQHNPLPEWNRQECEFCNEIKPKRNKTETFISWIIRVNNGFSLAESTLRPARFTVCVVQPGVWEGQTSSRMFRLASVHFCRRLLGPALKLGVSTFAWLISLGHSLFFAQAPLLPSTLSVPGLAVITGRPCLAVTVTVYQQTRL